MRAEVAMPIRPLLPFLPLALPALLAAADPPPLATVTLGQGWATFGQTLPRGAASTGLRVGTLATQTDVKNRWEDGSIKFAVVTAKIDTAGDYQIWPGTSASGAAVSPSDPQLEVRFACADGTYVATPDTTQSSDRWLSGPLVVETRTLATPAIVGGAAHPLLRLIVDTRCYADGARRVDLTVENPLNIAAATMVTYDVDVLVGGAERYQHAAVAQGWMTRWRQVFDDGLTESTVAPDIDVMQLAGAVPHYYPEVGDVVDDTSGPTYDILDRGGIPYTGMGAPGEDGRIGVLPWWDVRYIVHRRPEELHAVMLNGDLAGSWPIHLRLDDGNPANPDAADGVWFSYYGGIYGPKGDWSGCGPLGPEPAHTPSMAYFQYLISGDRYDVDEVRFWAAWGLSGLGGDDHGGRLPCLVYYEQTRAYAWQMRDWGEAAAYLPDGDPFQAVSAKYVLLNLQWADAQAADPGRWGIILGVSGSTADPCGTSVANWQLGYVTAALEHIYAMGIPGIGDAGRAAERQIAAYVLQWFTSPGFDRRYACSLWNETGYSIIRESSNSPDAGSYYPDMAAAFADIVVPGNTLPAEPFNYAPHNLAVLTMAKRFGLPGADDAFTYLKTALSYPGDTQSAVDWDNANRPGTAVDLSGPPIGSGATGTGTGGTGTGTSGTNTSGGGTSGSPPISGGADGSGHGCGLGGGLALLGLLTVLRSKRLASGSRRAASGCREEGRPRAEGPAHAG
jgi:hypothetical protein